MVQTSDVLAEKPSYFSEAVEFFDKYKWMFDFSNTEILVKDVLADIPDEWTDVFALFEEEQMSNYPEDLFVNNSWPSCLQKFTTSCKQLRIEIPSYQCPTFPQISKTLQRGIGEKKTYEIVTLAALINEKCKEKNIDCCVDLGSGVGYLDEVLVTNYNFRVVGLECDKRKINGALSRISKQNTNSNYLEKLKYICTYVESPVENRDKVNVIDNTIKKKLKEQKGNDFDKFSESNNSRICNCEEVDDGNKTSLHIVTNEILKEKESLESSNCTFPSDIEQLAVLSFNKSVLIKEDAHSINTNVEKAQMDCNSKTVSNCFDLQCILPKEPFCFIGLHTCGDLSVAAIQHFFSMTYAQQLIYIPCCYHRLKPNTNQNATTMFDNFPLSQSLKQAYEGKQMFKVPFLRLATQETAASWKNYSNQQRDDIVFQLLFRSVLELYADKENVKLIKKIRRPLKLNKNQNNDFIGMIEQSVEGYDLHCKTTNNKVEWNTQLLTELWREMAIKRQLVKVLLLLQNSIQSSAESLVLLDRLKFLHESGMKNIEVVQLFDQLVSPRRYCFVVGK